MNLFLIEDEQPSVYYKGSYMLGKREGLGKMVMRNGDKYHGEN
jgi:hypothetical protein